MMIRFEFMGLVFDAGTKYIFSVVAIQHNFNLSYEQLYDDLYVFYLVILNFILPIVFRMEFLKPILVATSKIKYNLLVT